MNFKKPKEEVAREAAMKAYSTISYNLNQHNNGNLSGLGHNITQAITDGIREALLHVMNETYTDVEFEEDVGLRNKS